MEQIITLILAEYISIERLWFVVFAALVMFFYRKEPFKLFTYFRDEKGRSIDQALSIYNTDVLTTEGKEVTAEYVERSLFKKQTKIDANKSKRKALVIFYKKHAEKIEWESLRRAFRFMQFEGERFNIKISSINIVESWLVNFLTWSMFLLASLIFFSTFILAVIHNEFSSVAFFKLIAMSLLYFFAGIAFMSANIPYRRAKKILKIKAEETCALKSE